MVGSGSIEKGEVIVVRPLRPDFTNTYHHVVVRGLNSLPIFDSQRKRETFLTIIQQTRQTHDLRMYAFGFLDNHWHVFVRRVDIPMARFFQTVKSRYTTWYNNQFDRKGTLYDGRYFSSIVEAEAYFHTVWRYVQHQGVQAGLYNRAEEDPGSTAGLYAGVDGSYGWIDWQEALRTLDVPVSGIGPELGNWIREQKERDRLPVRRVRDQSFVATDEYVEKYMQIRKSEVRKKDREATPLSWEQLHEGVEDLFGVSRDRITRSTKKRDLHRVRAGLAYAGRRYGHRSTGEIAEHLNVSDTTVSRMIRKVQENMPEVKQRWDQWIEIGNRGV